MTNNYIKDKNNFENTSKKFLKTIFADILDEGTGQIEIRIFPKGKQPGQYFFDRTNEAAEKAYHLCNSGVDVYFGVNPRTGGRGRKENIHYLTVFHVEVDYGGDGHKKDSVHKTYNDAYNAINEFTPRPTLINHSGGGFHCYWVLKTPVAVKEIGIDVLENINKSLSLKLGGDIGTQDISRVLRIPGTYNFKLENNPREVTVILDNGQKYLFEDFKDFGISEENTPNKLEKKDLKKTTSILSDINLDNSIDVDNLPVPDNIKSLIKNGNDGSYPSRSEADMAVIMSLVGKGVSESDIKKIFQNYDIGEKYWEHNGPDKYLAHSINSAKNMSGLTEEERTNPLFVSNSVNKKDNKLFLNVVKFEEYMAKKYRFKYLEDAKTFFRYNGQCYEYCSEESLNYMCQSELLEYRELFTKSSLKDFIHFAVGDKLVKSEKAQEDQISYLTLQNGLYDLREETLNAHTSDIFTTNLLPYDYDPGAKCPRFLQYLNEVFLDDKDKISFVQESVGYIFQKNIPKPSIFFLIGSGSNGKSVFVDTITNLIGQENTCSISLNALSNEYYLLTLFNKMLNISSETPRKKRIDTDLVKAVVAGDWVTGRVPYKQPTKFKSYAKHFLAMNEAPLIEDSTHGMWRRLYIIDFPRRFKEDEMDVHLTDKLRGELSGIFNWALAGYERLREKGFIFSQGKSMKKSKQEYKKESSSVMSFASQCLKKSNPENTVKFKEVYELYKQFCISEGYKTYEIKKDFKKKLEELGYHINTSTKNNNSICIFGVSIFREMEVY